MYLEISARRTGKTTRLCEAVVDHVINTSEPAFVVVPSWACRRELLNSLDEPLPGSVYVVPIDRIEEERDFSNGVKEFYDEFDFIPERYSHLLTISCKNYYVTTPKSLRSYPLQTTEDNLLKLMVANNFNYTQKSWE